MAELESLPSAITCTFGARPAEMLLAVPCADDQRQMGPSLHQPGLDRSDGILGTHEAEVAGARESLEELPAGDAPVLVHQQEGNVGNVQVGGVPQGQELDDGADQEHRNHLPVPPQLEEFLENDPQQAVHALASSRERRA